MARLAKVAQPLFGGDITAADQEIAVFGTMKTSPVYTVDMPTLMASSAYTGGWADAVEVGYAPFMEEMNGLQYGFSYQIAYQMQEGIPEWDADTTYYIGGVAKLVTANGMKVYYSIANNNKANLLTDTTKWKLWYDTSATYTKNRALISNGSGVIAVSNITSTELNYLDNVTSNIQTQLDNKQASETAVTHTANTAVGSGTNPVYVNASGVATASSSTVGSTTQPVYLESGAMTACTVEQVHVVVSTYRSGSSWYRVYDDGWVEQGGTVSVSVSGSGRVTSTITFLKPFADTNYQAFKNYGSSATSNAQDDEVSIFNKTSTTCKTISSVGDTSSFDWFACGMGA